MTTVVFAGPSLFDLSLDAVPGLLIRPPAVCGDVARAVREGATEIGLIDGRFETTASVWHKEILWGLSKGVRILGASSLGALRAAETWQFGMKGVGIVYRLYRSGALQDDDEVAVLHGPSEVGSIPLTEAMVNIRVTLRTSRRLGVISEETEFAIAGIAKSLYYKDRTYDRIFGLCERQAELRNKTPDLKNNLDVLRRDVKRDDAARLISRLHYPSTRRLESPSFTFAATTFWTTLEANLKVRADLRGPQTN
jgi:hypothetical protein